MADLNQAAEDQSIHDRRIMILGQANADLELGVSGKMEKIELIETPSMTA